jgi:tRNA (guanine-N7-)-methyltransferase
VKSAGRLQKQGLNNAAIVMARAQEFFAAFPKSCQGVCVFFPDPWPKERQKKHRLVSEDFAHLLKQKLSPGGFFWLKTDSLAYATEAQEALFLGGFVARINEVVLPQQLATAPEALRGEPLRTAFEELFHGQGLPTYAGVYTYPAGT